MSLLLQRLKWLIIGGSTSNNNNTKSPFLNHKPLNTTTSTSTNTSVLSTEKQQEKQSVVGKFKRPMFEAVHEIAIYIHRFHNLDLFQQGWYQIKVTMRWEDGEHGFLGTPARINQYEAPDLGSDDVYGVWRIDDTDHSFSTQPFRIRYARQDILLSMMVSFNLSLSKFEGPSPSAVILRFELLYTPKLENRSNIQDCLDACPAAVHEFRLPPKSLLGLHAYCPVHFDYYHAVLVDISVHASLLTSGAYTSAKVPSTNEDDAAREHDKSKQVMLVKALSSARDILVEELQNLSEAINHPIDFTDTSNKVFSFTPKLDLEKIANDEVLGQGSSNHRSVSEKQDFQNDVFLGSLSEDKLLKSLDIIGNQVVYLWSIFLHFHRRSLS